MRAALLIIAVLLGGCTGFTQVRGRYAAELSPVDVREIRRLVARPPHFGHTVITLYAVSKDRVRVETREYQESAVDGIVQYVIRRQGKWHVDDRFQPQWITERTVVTENRPKDLTRRCS
jgi:hypothetical protein